MAKNLVNGTSTTIQENGDNISIQINFPIGYIYMSTSSTNPSVYFGGTWERIAKGKTLVGVDENDADFNASSKTGGEKEHTLIVDEMPSHSHNIVYIKSLSTPLSSNGLSGYSENNNGVGTNTNAIQNAGGGQAHNNMQPFYTCYIFVRTA